MSLQAHLRGAIGAWRTAGALIRLEAPAFALLAAALLSACSLFPPAIGLVDITERPAERALLAGLRAYDEAQYDEAEKQLNLALRNGLASPRDRAAAHKHLAFIFCTSRRLAPCEDAFRAARDSDRSFALTRSEAGHPLWGPVYRRLFAQ